MLSVQQIVKFNNSQPTMSDMEFTNVTETKLILSVDKITDLKLFQSKKIYVRGQKWTISFEKTTQKTTNVINEDILAVNLNLKTEDTSNDWAIVAEFSVKFLKLGDSHEATLGPFVFDSKNLTWGRKVFITWQDLMDPQNGYVVNDACKFEIEIKCSAIFDVTSNEHIEFRTNQKCCGDSTYGKFRIKVNNLFELFGATSPEIQLNKMTWRILVVKGNDLRILLWNMDSKAGNSWTCETKFKCVLLSFDANTASITKECNRKGAQSSPVDVFSIPWNDMIDPAKRLLDKGAAVFEIEMKINHPEQPHSIEFNCPICLHSMVGQDVVSTGCGHLFDRTCATESLQQRNLCPVCNQETNLEQIRKIYMP